MLIYLVSCQNIVCWRERSGSCLERSRVAAMYPARLCPAPARTSTEIDIAFGHIVRTTDVLDEIGGPLGAGT